MNQGGNHIFLMNHSQPIPVKSPWNRCKTDVVSWRHRLCLEVQPFHRRLSPSGQPPLLPLWYRMRGQWQTPPIGQRRGILIVCSRCYQELSRPCRGILSSRLPLQMGRWLIKILSGMRVVPPVGRRVNTLRVWFRGLSFFYLLPFIFWGFFFFANKNCGRQYL